MVELEESEPSSGLVISISCWRTSLAWANREGSLLERYAWAEISPTIELRGKEGGERNREKERRRDEPRSLRRAIC